MELFQQIILGIIQGVTEWIPVSSEGFLLFATTNFFGEINIDLFLRQALFLHFGTFFAALIY
ncbi:undecaprenyl-diphosphate phosphatase, partial [archaeon]|nr:undecaprenyl-diphosphate phosphatase [archaeon]